MPEGFEQNRPANPHPVHALGPVHITVDSWTSRASSYVLVVAVHRLEAQNLTFANSTVTVDNASDQTLRHTGMRCLAHLANLQARAQDHQMRQQSNLIHSPIELGGTIWVSLVLYWDGRTGRNFE
ncbi:hypothetical protein DFH07DRAFT_766981 [Mycena maculata]|uniref:Uncharacterized protein n=1 Tax=Mycena maculata TaxID=230809 RepID=A0AAD7K325_9AGAR|nr:hypothetical protein DFH07DRAFT_766981 [Mycena maculata]